MESEMTPAELAAIAEAARIGDLRSTGVAIALFFAGDAAPQFDFSTAAAPATLG